MYQRIDVGAMRDAMIMRPWYETNKVVDALQEDKPLNDLKVNTETYKGRIPLSQYLASIDPIGGGTAQFCDVSSFEIFRSFTRGFVDNWDKFEGVSSRGEAEAILNRFNLYTWSGNPRFRKLYYDTLRYALLTEERGSSVLATRVLGSSLKEILEGENARQLGGRGFFGTAHSQTRIEELRKKCDNLPRASLWKPSTWINILDRLYEISDVKRGLRKEVCGVIQNLNELGDECRDLYVAKHAPERDLKLRRRINDV